MSEIEFICNACSHKFDLLDFECPKCNDREKEIQEYCDETLKNVKKEIKETLLRKISDPNIHFADTDDDMVTGIYMGPIDELKDMPKDRIFIEGFKFGLEEAIGWLECTMSNYGIYGNEEEDE